MRPAAWFYLCGSRPLSLEARRAIANRHEGEAREWIPRAQLSQDQRQKSTWTAGLNER